MPELVTQIWGTAADNPALLASLFGISVFTFIGSLLLLPWLIIRLPQNYFTDEKRHLSGLHRNKPIIYALLRISKNLLGFILLLAGVLMLVLPGQGLLTILLGISLLDFPGKFRLERNLIRRPGINRFINWIRKKRNKPPLDIP